MVRKRRRENWKMESNDRGWRGSIFRPSWNSRHVYNVARSKWDGCAFKESAYDGKVSRRVAYVPWFPSIYALYMRLCVCVYTARCSETKECSMCYGHEGVFTEASASIFAGIYFRYSLSRMYEAIQIFKFLRSTNFLCCSKLSYQLLLFTETNRWESLTRAR